MYFVQKGNSNFELYALCGIHKDVKYCISLLGNVTISIKAFRFFPRPVVVGVIDAIFVPNFCQQFVISNNLWCSYSNEKCKIIVKYVDLLLKKAFNCTTVKHLNKLSSSIL